MLRLDIFGEPVSFKVAGESRYNSCVGLLLTVALVLLTVAFAGLKVLSLWNYSVTSHASQVKQESLDPREVFSYD